jgi:hypothetical protein
MVRSGFGCSVRPTPGRLLRRGRSVAGLWRSYFCPCEGGFEELPGVFGGRVSSFSRAFQRRDAGVLCCDMGGLRGKVGVRQRQPSSQCRNQRVLLEVASVAQGR